MGRVTWDLAFRASGQIQPFIEAETRVRFQLLGDSYCFRTIRCAMYVREKRLTPATSVSRDKLVALGRDSDFQ